MADILIVDDERTQREGMKAFLTAEGHFVTLARDGEEALKKIAERRPQLVLLDVMMPKMNGFRCCEAIRRIDALLPVVFLTAKDSETDQVRGLGLGADDYVSKAAGEAVLLARIDRALERVRKMGEKVSRPDRTEVVLGTVTVDFKSNAVREHGKEIARLTKTECDIIRFLDAHRGEMVVADDLIDELRGKGFACVNSMLYTHIWRLRKKLGPAAGKIISARDVGYGLLA